MALVSLFLLKPMIDLILPVIEKIQRNAAASLLIGLQSKETRLSLSI
jgi:hypothetical protein